MWMDEPLAKYAVHGNFIEKLKRNGSICPIVTRTFRKNPQRQGQVVEFQVQGGLW